MRPIPKARCASELPNRGSHTESTESTEELRTTPVDAVDSV